MPIFLLSVSAGVLFDGAFFPVSILFLIVILATCVGNVWVGVSTLKCCYGLFKGFFLIKSTKSTK